VDAIPLGGATVPVAVGVVEALYQTSAAAAVDSTTTCPPARPQMTLC
jgi:hypothetical protein